MRPKSRAAVTRTYRLVSRPPAPEDLVVLDEGVVLPRFEVEYSEQAAAEASRWLDRFPDWLEVADKEVLDVGCGPGDLCLEAARRGSRKVVGVEVAQDRVSLARAKLRRADRDLAVDIRLFGGDLQELDGELFDLVLSKDSFEHYGALPGTPSAEQMVHAMAERLRDGGLLVIGFGPFWKAPFGGHIDVKLPWAHLLFPESVIFEEFRRARPAGKTARTFEEGVGVNRMTVRRFDEVMRASRLDPLHLEYNVTHNRLAVLMNGLRRLPTLGEYFTQNAYGVWRRPPGWCRPEGA